jgi:hypothetical protein
VKFLKKRERGKGGWWYSELCFIRELLKIVIPLFLFTSF